MANKRTIAVKTTYADSNIYFEFSDSLEVNASSSEEFVEEKKRELMRGNIIALNNWIAETTDKAESKKEPIMEESK